jgi:CO dehydrogenase nickel-insertion accessory protein CooC1
MKILICGKGGSGKSTISSLLAKSMARKGYNVLVTLRRENLLASLINGGVSMTFQRNTSPKRTE